MDFNERMTRYWLDEACANAIDTYDRLLALGRINPEQHEQYLTKIKRNREKTLWSKR